MKKYEVIKTKTNLNLKKGKKLNIYVKGEKIAEIKESNFVEL